MYEWDLGAYARKFLGTKAHCSIGGAPPRWIHIGRFREEGGIVEDIEKNVLGEVLFEENGLQELTNLPKVQFFYTPIKCGFYRDLARDQFIYLVMRKHVKSWKIGFSHESFTITRFNKYLGDYLNVPTKCTIDLDSPITSSAKQGELKLNAVEVFSSGLMSRKKSLLLYDQEIGFMEGNKIILKDMAFSPLLKPLLENKWEIVDLPA